MVTCSFSGRNGLPNGLRNIKTRWRCERTRAAHAELRLQSAHHREDAQRRWRGTAQRTTRGLCIRVIEQRHPTADAAAQPNDAKPVSHDSRLSMRACLR
jgi:hypothetical protein